MTNSQVEKSDDEFERWWASTWASNEAVPALQLAFKEIARKAWDAARESAGN